VKLKHLILGDILLAFSMKKKYTTDKRFYGTMIQGFLWSEEATATATEQEEKQQTLLQPQKPIV
jgi:hypothetical protein